VARQPLAGLLGIFRNTMRRTLAAHPCGAPFPGMAAAPFPGMAAALDAAAYDARLGGLHTWS